MNIPLALLVIAGLSLLTGILCAAPPLPTPAADPDALVAAKATFCNAKKFFSGNLALLIGFLIAVGGLWSMIGGNVKAGIFLIIAGALLTAVPSLIVSTFQGVNSAVAPLQNAPTPLPLPTC